MLSNDDITLKQHQSRSSCRSKSARKFFKKETSENNSAVPATELTGKMTRERDADALVRCSRGDICRERLESRIGGIDGFKTGTVLVRPMCFDNFPWKRGEYLSVLSATFTAEALTLNGIALERAAVGQACESADATSPASAGRNGPQGSERVLFRDNAKDKRIEYGEAALPLVAAVPNNDAGVVGQSADVVPDFSVLHWCVQRGACM